MLNLLKKMTAFTLVLCMLTAALLLTACGNNNNQNDNNNDNPVSDNQGTNDTPASDSGTDSDNDSNAADNNEAGTPNAGLNAPLSEMFAALSADVEIPYMAGEIEVTEDNAEYMIFVPYDAENEYYVSEAMINAQAHSIALIRTPNEEKAKTLYDEIKANVNPSKWICVTAETSDVLRNGNVILMLLTDKAIADPIAANFNALK